MSSAFLELHNSGKWLAGSSQWGRDMSRQERSRRTAGSQMAERRLPDATVNGPKISMEASGAEAQQHSTVWTPPTNQRLDAQRGTMGME